MSGFFFLSVATHAAIVVAVIVFGIFFSKPKLKAYSVDFMSAPLGGTAAEQVTPPAPVEPKAPEPPKPPPEQKVTPKEAIKLPPKEKPKPVQKAPAKAALAKPKNSAAFAKAMKALQAEGPEGPAARASSVGATPGAGVVGQAGPSFPYPWYLKIIADKLDRQWHPPDAFQADTTCVVTFLINRDGSVADVSVEKASEDDTFDGLAQRAVHDANPLPGLPSGYPEDTLRVHMTFEGKSG